MEQFTKIYFSIQPKFGKANEEQVTDSFFFDWMIYEDDPENPARLNNKQKLLLFQMFITQQAGELLHGYSGIKEDYQAAKPKHILTKKQKETIYTGLSKLYFDTMKRYFNEQELMIEKPSKPILHENN